MSSASLLELASTAGVCFELSPEVEAVAFPGAFAEPAEIAVYFHCLSGSMTHAQGMPSNIEDVLDVNMHIVSAPASLPSASLPILSSYTKYTSHT